MLSHPEKAQFGSASRQVSVLALKNKFCNFFPVDVCFFPLCFILPVNLFAFPLKIQEQFWYIFNSKR